MENANYLSSVDLGVFYSDGVLFVVVVVVVVVGVVPKRVRL
jgi:hypothetical protein